jgi:hypothetical protein
MKSFDIYVEHYLEENTFTVYIHHGGGSDELVYPIELVENITIHEARNITNDLINSYSQYGVGTESIKWAIQRALITLY